MNVFISFIIAWFALSVYGLPNERIIGGQNAPSGAFPYQVSLRHRGFHTCGGAIINQNVIITAAHCVYGERNNLFTVAVGSNYLHRPGTVYQVDYIFVHPYYDPSSLTNDIALLYILKNITFNQKIAPIALPYKDYNYNKHNFFVASGWGLRKYRGKISNNLQCIRLRGYSQRKCKQIFGNITHTNICTLTKVGQGMCYGDSGGPLVDINSNTLVGITSYVAVPCSSGYPDVFTRVYYYKSWMLFVIWSKKLLNWILMYINKVSNYL